MDTLAVILEVFEMADSIGVRAGVQTAKWSTVRAAVAAPDRCRRSLKTTALDDRAAGPGAEARWQRRWRSDDARARRAMRLRRENRKLKEEREIFSKAAAWFATESGTSKRSSGS